MGFAAIKVMLNFMVLQTVFGINPHQLQEFCTLETFAPSCALKEVVIIDKARYGRMKLGRCVDRDFGYVGCSADVLQQADKLCSGEQACSITVPNTDMNENVYSKCLHKSISPYMESSYHCQKVYTPRNNHCIAPERIPLSNQDLFIASKTSTETSCGLHESPWIIDAKAGQQIEITITDFSWENKTSSNPRVCDINYGYILDMKTDDVISICGGTKRHRHLYTSVGNSVQIMLERTAIQINNFLIQFKAIGCPEYKPPLHSWIQKNNDTLEIGCVSSDKKWKLMCVDHRWLGMVGNCTSPTTPVTESNVLNKVIESQEDEETTGNVPYISNNHVIVFTLGCLTLLICLSVIILGVYCVKRYEVKIKKYRHNSTLPNQQPKVTLGRPAPIYRPVNTCTIPPVSTIQPGTFKPPTMTSSDTLNPPAYTFPLPKDARAPKVPPRNASFKSNQPATIREVNENNTYENVEDNDSVQYYVLENPAEYGDASVQERMYQTLRLNQNTLN